MHTALELDKVIFMPAGQPWQKTDRHITSAQHRLAMVHCAVASDDRFAVSDREIVRGGSTYSIDTVRALKVENPADELFWIVGSDALAGIPTWHEWEEFVTSVKVVSVDRDVSTGTNRSDIDLPFRYSTVAMPQVRISATQLRSRFAADISCKYLVPDEVIEYILDNRLYS